jgi:hypothetical protein
MPCHRTWRAGAGKFLGNDARLQDVRLAAIATIGFRDRACGEAVPDQQLLPGDAPRILVTLVLRRGGEVAVLRECLGDFGAKGFVFGIKVEFHARI